MPENIDQQRLRAASSSVTRWDELIDSLRSLPDRMLANLPESMRIDPQIQQEVGRLALESLTSNAIDAIAGDGDFPHGFTQMLLAQSSTEYRER